MEANLGNVFRPNRGNIDIDPHWIEPEKMQVLNLSRHHSSYQIMLIPVGGSQVSKPILFASGTTDRKRAEAMCQRARGYVQSFKPGGDNAGKELTLKTIGDFVHQELPPDEIIRKPTAASFKYEVRGGGDIKLRVTTPYMEANKDNNGVLHHRAFLYFSPPRSQGCGYPHASMITYDVNTQDPKLAALRMHTIKHIAISVLDRYFKEHPNVSILTEMHDAVQAGKPVRIEAFAKQVIKRDTAENHIMFEELREAIKAKLEDYTRYINWETRIEEAQDGKWVAHFQVKRNDGEPIPGDENVEAFAARFKTKGEAKVFTDTLEATIIGAQFATTPAQPIADKDWTKTHISRQRPVAHFSIGSTAMVVRESLRSALKDRDVDLMGSNVLATLVAPSATGQESGRGHKK